MNCRDVESLLNARLDDELDVAGSMSLDRHLAECRACAAQYAALEGLQQEIAAAQPGYPLPSKLEKKLAAQFAPRKKLWPMLAASGGLAAAAVVALWFILPMARNTDAANAVAAEILDNHLRALQPGHLFDVESTDQHTVKPWFQGKTDFSPPVPDLSNDGFTLVGGRLEVIGRQPAAAVAYRRRQHVISLYVMRSSGGDRKAELREMDGYHLLHWQRENLGYWAVSDVSSADLQDFVDLIQ